MSDKQQEMRKAAEAIFSANRSANINKSQFRRNTIKKLKPLGTQVHHTPFDLCDDIVSKLTELIDLKDKQIAVLFNLEFIPVLVEDFGINPSRITFISDDSARKAAAHYWYNVENVFNVDCNQVKRKNGEIINMAEFKKRFDVVIQNPPYHAEVKGNDRNTVIWDKFIDLANDICKKDGWIGAVHPASWRQPINNSNALWEKMRSRAFSFLSIHSKKEGEKVFGATTRFDWYVVQNTEMDKNKKTRVEWENGLVSSVILAELPFLPNAEFSMIQQILVKENEPPCEILFSQSAYEPRKTWMSSSQTKQYKHPCVYLLNAKGMVPKYSSVSNKGHFGVSKVIVSCGERPYPMIDMDGKYGMCQAAFGIPVSSKTEAMGVKKALESELFEKIIFATKWGNFRIDPNMFKYFRKDFWKEFV